VARGDGGGVNFVSAAQSGLPEIKTAQKSSRRKDCDFMADNLRRADDDASKKSTP
jgi:hypothetical protein